MHYVASNRVVLDSVSTLSVVYHEAVSDTTLPGQLDTPYRLIGSASAHSGHGHASDNSALEDDIKNHNWNG